MYRHNLHPDFLEYLVRRTDSLDSLDYLAFPENLDYLVLRIDYLDFPENLEILDYLDSPDYQYRRKNLDFLDCPDYLVFPDYQPSQCSKMQKFRSHLLNQ